MADVALMSISGITWCDDEGEERAEYCTLSTRQDIMMERNKMQVDPNL